MHQNGDWPYWIDPVNDAEEIANNQRECDELCRLLSQLNENEIELYGFWTGDEEDDPLIHEEVTFDDIRRELFHFKQGGFYRVKLR